ncbi:MAG: hypothetical protein C0404_14145 [Verrucomicrobia bacterium]|nr:hypothetical protein [Verrucomicrobiota bacterium]
MSSPEWRNLERILKKVGYGSVFDLPIEHGMPRLDRELRYRKSEMLNPCNSKRTGPKEGDGLRDARFVNLIRICEMQGDVVITMLEVQDGLPHRIETEGSIRLL